MATELHELSATELVAAYALGNLSPVEVVRATLDRIEALDPVVNAFVLVDADRALRDAAASEARWRRGEPAGPVDGVPATVKDLLVVQGWPTRRGSRTTSDAPGEEDGPPIARLRAQGAVFVGKTTTSEFGWKGVTDSPLTGITRNPWNPALTSGGSSGGAAAASALGLGVLHLATDGGGSIRIPSGFCGQFGFKPTFGVIPVHPHSPALTLWHQGPITRTVTDAALMMDVMVGPDDRDWYQVPVPSGGYRDALSRGVRGLRIGYSATLGYGQVDPEVASLVEAGVRRFESLGAVVEPLDLGLEDPIEIMRPLWSVALALALERMDAQQRELLDENLPEMAEEGRTLSALEYRRLEQRREAFARRLCLLHRDYDLVVTPQLAVLPFEVSFEVPPGTEHRRWWEWSPFTYPFNLSQQPVASIPCGLTESGLPVSLQVAGRKFADVDVVAAAGAFETLGAFARPPMCAKWFS